MILEVNGVSFQYNSHATLEDVRFTVNKGELLAILGPNGAGKTTLLKCMNAIHKADSGSILLEGKPINRIKPREIARMVGYVAQKSESTRMTVYDAVLMGRKPHIHWRASTHELEMVNAILCHLDLEHLSLRHLNELSGGELQQVAVARALIQEPQLLLLDEPTSSLDLKNQMRILHMIRRTVDEHGVAAIMTMHDINSALRVADRFLFLKKGKVYAACDCNEINAAMVENVYELPVIIEHVNGVPFIIPVPFSTKNKEEICTVPSPKSN